MKRKRGVISVHSSFLEHLIEQPLDKFDSIVESPHICGIF